MINPFKSLIGTIRITMSVIFFVLAGILTYLLIGEKILDTKNQIDQMSTNFLENQKVTIQTQVRHTIDFVKYQRSLAEQRIRSEIKNKVGEAITTAQFIFEKYKHLPHQEIEQKIIDSLYPAAWNGGKGYYFVLNLNGVLIFSRNNPELAGKKVSEVADSSGRKIFESILAIASSPEKEGYLTYDWNFPGQPETELGKITFVKLFEPIGWVIGTGKYVSDEEEQIKAEVIHRIENITFGESGYIFAGTFDGKSLSGPFKGRNMLDFTDPNGVRVVAGLINAARNGGGFVQYIAPGFKGMAPRPKISYAEPVQDWGWYIGTGVFLDTIDQKVTAKKHEMQQKIKSMISQAAFFLVVFWLTSLLFLGFLSSKIKANIARFSFFFRQSAKDAQIIKNDQISFLEFKTLAQYANTMSENRKKAEQKLRKSEEKYRHLFNHTPAGIYEIDLKTNRFKHFNDYLCEYIGYTREELMALDPLALLTEGSKKAFVKRYEKMLGERKQNDYMEFDVIKKNRDVFTAVFRSEFFYRDNVPESVRVVVTDISRLKKIEEIVSQSDKMTALGGLALGMAHELNNPLAGMVQNAQLIKQRFTPELPANQKAADRLGIPLEILSNYVENRQINTLTNHIVQAGGKAAQIIESVLNFANQGKAVRKKQLIGPLIDAAVRQVQAEPDFKQLPEIESIRIETEYQKQIPEVLCDGPKVQQVLHHLLANAFESLLKKDPEQYHPLIIIRSFLKSNHVHITVEDNGVGLSPDLKKRLFEPFFTTKNVNEGLGLGLSIAYFIVVSDHGGSLDVESIEGKGATFTVKLPL